MSGTFPTSPAPSSMVQKSIQPTMVSQSHSLKRNVRSRGGQRWAFSLSFQARRRAEMAPLIAFALSQRGQYGTFSFVPAVIGKRQATGGGTPVIRTTTASGRTVPVTGVTPSQTLGLAGDFIKFGSHSKVYMLTADAAADINGNVDLSIEPALYAQVAQAESVILDNVSFTVAFASDLVETPIEPPLKYSWNCELVEVLP
ncbi:MAG: hypothetical protein H6R10_698 [Rhodocyclaceae bacterium]|nr:hypothetical protein [Rhodocyclaceae bacterium]